MNKRILFWIWFIVCIVICSGIFFLWPNNDNSLPTEYEFTSSVTTPFTLTLPDSVPVIYYYIDNDYRDIDTAIVSDGRVSINLVSHNNALVHFIVPEGEIFVIFADGNPVSYNVEHNTWQSSLLNNLFLIARNEIKKRFEAPLNELYGQYYSLDKLPLNEQGERRHELDEQINQMEGEYAEYVKNFASENKRNILAAYDLAQVYHEFDYAELTEILDSANVFSSHPILDGAKRFRNGLYKRRSGIQFTDMTMQDTDGNSVNLSDYVGRGNYVFVDFWASWCPPCRGELPNILKVYEKYNKSEGFDVVGVSVDNSKAAWVACINKYSLPWRHMSELVGRDGLTKQIYGVGAIPCSILIDPEGSIIDCDLRGDDLMKRMREIYGY